ncbi:flagellin [Methylorubrum salsuginis]|uniref:Flagellin N-terminal helical region n=1 Tax=Methylorubrum salsuginis TaxID=414703 RepID=A0A1I4DN79_9HYPH|nr:flagellin [Methylorubrum salsuginis]SFK95032.1 flagellin N-terminal helical region [Methylorubrum salsuginis]
MTSISAFAAGTYRFDRQASNLVGMKSELDDLSRQLATGRTAETYGGLGAGRSTSLSARAGISAQDGYLAAITTADTRVKLTTASLTQIKTLSDSARSNLNGLLTSQNKALPSTSVQLADNNLSAAIDALNQQVGDVYVFSGRATDTRPVASRELILNGDSTQGLAGVKDLIAEQKKADLGPDGNGRLSQSRIGADITLTEDANAEARANFGFSIVGATVPAGGTITTALTAATPATASPVFAENPTDGTRVRVAVNLPDGSQATYDLTARTSVATGSTDSFAIGASPEETAANLRTLLKGLPGEGALASAQSASPPGLSVQFEGGSPASLALSVAGTPKAGDALTVTLAMHDGTTKTIKLTARGSADPASATTFAIGATPEDTAANLNQTLGNALKTAADTDLAASSTTRAATNFFEGSPTAGLAPRRVSADGNGYDPVAGAGTVIWYQGDDSADPRATATVQVGASRTVQIGAQANEAAIRKTLAGLAAVAAENFTDATGAVDTARFNATAERVSSDLTPDADRSGLEGLVTDFGLASSSMANAKSVANATKATLENSLDGIDTVSTQEVAAKLVSLQTQLQASYKVTSMLSEMSLVNYLR